MRKIPTIFVRDPDDMSRVTEEWHPDCLWVRDGEGKATIKWDGTACLVRNGVLCKRREVRDGKPIPLDFIEESHVNGKRQGWVPCRAADPADRWHWEAYDITVHQEGTYELVGPKVQGNPHGLTHHALKRHGLVLAADLGRTPGRIRDALLVDPVEGIVYHHPDGRMAKVKRRDFGLPWPVAKGGNDE